MELDLDKRLDIYHEATKEVQDIYGGTETTAIIRGVADNLELEEPDRGVFVVTVGDIILGIYKKESLGQLLRDRLSFTEEQLNMVRGGLNDFLNKIPQSEENHSPTIISFRTAAEALAAQPSVASSVKQESPSPVKPLRTFADDVGLSRAHGYGAFRSNENQNTGVADDTVHRSSQDDIIGK